MTALYLFSLFIYLFTIFPVVSSGDGGELASCCYLLSIAHPTGYPLYTLIGKLFTFLPVGSIGYRVNFLSCFFSSLTTVILYKILKNLLKNNFIIPVFSSLLFAFSPAIWYQSLLTEVYSLNIFFFSILIFIFIIWREKRNLRLLYIFTFLYGVSFSHYFLVITYLPVFLYILLKENKKIPNPLFLIFIFMLGANIYTYIPVRSITDYPFARFNAHTLSSFLDFINAEGFKEISLDLERYKEVFPNLIFYFLSQFSLFGVIVFLWGIYRVRREDIFLSLFLISSILINLFFSLPASFSFDIESFISPTYFLMSIGIALGLSYIFRKIAGRIFLGIFIIYFFLILPQRFSYLNHQKNILLYKCTEKILKKIPRNSILIASNSSTYFSFLFIYLQNVEKIREDVILVYPMYTRSVRYIEYLKKRYPQIKLNKNIFKLSSLKRRNLKNILPEKFWEFYYKKHLFMKWGNFLSNGAVTEGISNHYRCLYIASEIIDSNIENFNIYLLNNEIFETPGLGLERKYLLVPENFLFKIVRIKDYKEKGISFEEEFKIPRFSERVTKEFFQNLYIEIAKANYRLKKEYIKYLRKAEEINPKISEKGIEKILKENYRGISDRAVSEFLEFKNN